MKEIIERSFYVVCLSIGILVQLFVVKSLLLYEGYLMVGLSIVTPMLILVSAKLLISKEILCKSK